MAGILNVVNNASKGIHNSNEFAYRSLQRRDALRASPIWQMKLLKSGIASAPTS
jgi:hypothetical protein